MLLAESSQGALVGNVGLINTLLSKLSALLPRKLTLLTKLTALLSRLWVLLSGLTHGLAKLMRLPLLMWLSRLSTVMSSLTTKLS